MGLELLLEMGTSGQGDAWHSRVWANDRTEEWLDCVRVLQCSCCGFYPDTDTRKGQKNRLKRGTNE